jgi:hypothetical protein
VSEVHYRISRESGIFWWARAEFSGSDPTVPFGLQLIRWFTNPYLKVLAASTDLRFGVHDLER